MRLLDIPLHLHFAARPLQPRGQTVIDLRSVAAVVYTSRLGPDRTGYLDAHLIWSADTLTCTLHDTDSKRKRKGSALRR